MSTIEQNLQKIVDAKADIRTAIQNKGVAVPDTASISDYNDYIDQIFTGVTPPIVQVKDYTATTNGDVIIYPDSGYDMLSWVHLHIDVPQYDSKVFFEVNKSGITITLEATAPDFSEIYTGTTDSTGQLLFIIPAGVHYTATFEEIEGYDIPKPVQDISYYNTVNSYMVGYYAYDEYDVKATWEITLGKYVSIIGRNSSSMENISAIRIDDGEWLDYTGQNSTYMNVGTHSVYYRLKHYTVIPNNFLYGLEMFKVEVGQHVWRLGNDLFSDTLTTLYLPNSVEDFKAYVFRYCTHLNNITILSTNPPDVHSSSYSDYLPANGTLYIPIGCTHLYESRGWDSFGWNIIEIEG